jgi:hypothetical protein
VPSATHKQIVEMASAAAERGLRVALVDLSHRGLADTSSDVRASDLLEELAAAGGGEVHRFAASDDLCWLLIESLTGTSPVVGQDAKLRVKFNPRAVAAYRLVGHEAGPLGTSLAPATAILHSGESASVMYELWLHPNSDDDDVATAALEWFDPQSGQMRHAASQRISRLQFATSFAESPLSLQAGLLAAETAAVLKQSYDFVLLADAAYAYAPKTRDLTQVLEAGRRVNPRLATRPDFQRFLTFVGEADRALRERRLESAKSGARGIIGGRWQELVR